MGNNSCRKIGKSAGEWQLNEYITVSGETVVQTEVKRSRFIATLRPVKTEKEALDFVNEMRKKYWDAKHNVYAFSLRENNNKRFSDDGEPHSTAGLPVMEAIEHSAITDVAIVVTRYFGGVLLGTGGLVRAYSDAATLAIKNANTVTVKAAKKYTVNCSYGDYEIFCKICAETEVKMLDTVYSEKIAVTFAVAVTEDEFFKAKCTDVFCGKMDFGTPEEIFIGF